MGEIIWSIKDPSSVKESPINSWPILLIKFIDDLVPRFGIFKNIPTIGGDLYDFSSKGLIKFVIDKIQGRQAESVISFRIVHMPMVLVLDAELSKEILMCKKVKRGRIYKRLGDFFGFGIFTSGIHDQWHHQRKVMFKLFQRRNLEEITPRLAESMFRMFDSKLESGNPIELQSVLSNMGLVGFCDVMFGVDITDIYSELTEPLNRLLAYINGAIEPFVIEFDPSYQKFCSDRHFVHNWIRELIDRARESPLCNPDLLLELHNENLTEKELVQFVLSIVFGGHETTSKLMLAITYSLYHNREAISKLNAETDAYFKTHNTYQLDIIKEPYLRNIIREGTRLYPSAWILSREAQEEISFGPDSYEKGTQFLISPLIFLRSEKIWGPNAEVFDPDRFDNLTDSARKTFIPFVVGAENCPGKIFAELEASIVISNLFYHYQLEFLEHELVINSAITLRIVDRLPTIVRKRT